MELQEEDLRRRGVSNFGEEKIGLDSQQGCRVGRRDRGQKCRFLVFILRVEEVRRG